MDSPHFQNWPPCLARSLSYPRTTLIYNLEVSAARYPDKALLSYYDSAIGDALRASKLLVQALSLVGFLVGFNANSEEIPTNKEGESAGSMYEECSGLYGDGACVAYTKSSHAIVRARPQKNSAALRNLGKGEMLLVLQHPDESERHPGWVRVKAVNDRGEGIISWIHRTDVVFRWEFRRVVNCWPVRSVNWSEDAAGDYDGTAGDVWFDTKGNIVEPDVRSAFNWTEYINDYSVYYKSGLFQIWQRQPPDRYSPSFVLDHARRRVRMVADSGQHKGVPLFRLHSPSTLKGCTQIPVMDETQQLFPNPISKQQ